MSKFPQYKTAKVKDLLPYARNSRTHSPQQVDKIAASIKEFGFINPVIVDGDNGIIAGHGRIMAAQKLCMDEVPTIEASHLTDAQRRAYIIADNRLALDAGWDDEMLRVEFAELADMGFDLELTGFGLDEIEALDFGEDADQERACAETGAGSLAARFGVAPFTVINARDGWWQDRKKNWLSLGIRSEIGRDAECNASTLKPHTGDSERLADKGVSVFDPVLCELAYNWFSPDKGVVLDPFAGGSVRGVVASKLGRQYVGHELRQEQVEANRVQASSLCEEPAPVWICGDSRSIDKTCAGVEADFLFSCPPYADLEVYSDNPSDLSTMCYEDFKSVYFEIIKKSCDILKNDRFACFVVGEVRDKKGNYYNFVGDTIAAFLAAGMSYYNEAILVTMTGNLQLRAARPFEVSRKMGKTHQNILVFVKGDAKKAAVACGECVFADMEQPENV